MTAPRRPRSAWLLVGSTPSVWVKVQSAGEATPSPRPDPDADQAWEDQGLRAGLRFHELAEPNPTRRYPYGVAARRRRSLHEGRRREAGLSLPSLRQLRDQTCGCIPTART